MTRFGTPSCFLAHNRRSCRFLIFLFALETLSHSVPAQPVISDPREESVSLQISSGDINILLETYEKISGKTVVRDAGMPTVTNIRIVVPGSIPKSQALRLLESVFMLNGYAFIPAEDNSIKMVGTSGGKNARSEGLPVYANLADLPKGDQVVTYFMQFQYLAAQDAVTLFQAQIPPHPWGAFIAVPQTQALLVTENASTIRKMSRIQQLVDVPPAKLVTHFVPLQHADAERVATLVEKLIDERKSKSTAGNHSPATKDKVQTSEETPVPAITPDSTERNLVTGDIQLVPDPRTNRILVITSPSDFEYLKNLIEEFDQAVTLTAPLDRPLKYLVASEILPVLETMLLESSEDKAVHSSPTNTPLPLSGNPSINPPGGSDELQTAVKTLREKQDTAPQAVLIGKTRLIADNQANSIIVIGPPENIAKVKTILDSLDKKPLQVYLSTVIGQLTLNDSSELAIDVLHKFSKAGDFGYGGLLHTRAKDPILEPSSLTSAAAISVLPAGLTLYGAIGSAIDYYVKALASTNRFKLISRPVVYTTNNKSALIASGQKIAVPSSTLTALDNGSQESGSVISNINYTAVELKLEVVPTINSNREVTLKIKQTNDSVVGSTVISGNNIPTIGTQTVDTTITVRSGSTIVLGGLITEDNNTSVNGVPYLKDIPVLGYLFKGTVKTKNRSELIIMIQPIVVGIDGEEVVASQVEVDRNKIGAESKAFSDNVPFPPLPSKKTTSSKPSGRGLIHPVPEPASKIPLSPPSVTP